MTDHAIPRALLVAIQSDALKALESVAAKHGVTIRGGRGTYGATGKLTFEILPKDASGAAITPEAAHFEILARSYGLEPGDLGKTIVSRGNVFTIVGLNPGAPKYPILASSRGKVFRFQAASVARQLHPAFPGSHPASPTPKGA